jgi:ATP-binding cassette subfamily C protein
VTAYLRALGRLGAATLWWQLALLLLVNAFEGVGVLMLVPLLAVAGVFEPTGVLDGLSAQVIRLFGAAGLSPTLPVVLLMFVGLVCARQGLVRLQTTTAHALGERFVFALRQRLYLAVTAARWLFLTRTRSSEILQVLTADTGRLGGGTQQLVQTVSAGVMLAVYGLMMLWISPVTTGLVAVIGGVVLFGLRHTIRRASQSGQQVTGLGKQFYAAVVEHLAGMRVSKSFGAETRSVEHFVDTIRQVRGVATAYQVDRADTRFWFAAGSAVILSGVFYVAVDVLATPGPELLVLVLVFARMMPRVSGLVQGYQQALHMVPAFDSYTQLLTRCTAEAEAATESPGPPLSFTTELRFARVSFQYRDGAANAVLRDVSFRIVANQTTAIVGPSGAGKSTVADLLMGLLTPDSGTIQIDGQELTDENIRSWRRNIGYVPQDTFLFHDTVRANLSWVRPDVSDVAIWEALEMAAAGEFVRTLPHGLDTEVGERGVQLSGGERQRLALARALVVSPKLLILDEATSHLDVENERRIQAALDALHGRLTVVVIAHRLSTVRQADQIVVLDNGAVAEVGSWEALNRHQGRFAQLVHAHPSDSDG